MAKRVFNINGNYIAEQTNYNTYIAHADNVQTPHASTPPTSRDIEDTPFEEIPTYCTYLDIDAIKQSGIRTPEQIQRQLELESMKECDEFVAFLRDYEKKHYLNFRGNNKRKVYNTLRAQLSMMRPYSESNFYAYF